MKVADIKSDNLQDFYKDIMADKIFDEMYKNKNKMKKDELYHNKYVREGIKPDKKKTDDLAFSLSNFK